MSNLDYELKMLRNNRLGKEDIFDFKCKACGKCCRRHDDIVLTPYDLYEIAAKLEISVEEVVYNNCVQGIGEISKLPFVMVRHGKCTFLAKDGCILGNRKPVKCRIYPLGRGCDDDKLVYFNQPVNCGERNPMQTVADWLERNGVTEENERYTVQWYGLLSKLTAFIYERRFSSNELDAFQRALVPILYLCYRTDQYFYAQFLDRYECLERIMKQI